MRPIKYTYIIIFSDNCSHARSNLYFVESVISDQFRATPCSSWEDYVVGLCQLNESVVFGENVSKDSLGTYYFETNPEPPFAKCDTCSKFKVLRGKHIQFTF